MPRRRLLAWSFATLTAILLLALLVSTRGQLYLSTTSGYDAALLAGWLHLTYFDPSKLSASQRASTVTGLHWDLIPWQLRWNFAFHRDGVGWLINIPLWCPLLLSAAATVFLWRRSLRPSPSHCPNCHYNLRGIPPSSNGLVSCPECGNSANPPARATNLQQ